MDPAQMTGQHAQRQPPKGQGKRHILLRATFGDTRHLEQIIHNAAGQQTDYMSSQVKAGQERQRATPNVVHFEGGIFRAAVTQTQGVT